MNWLVRRDVLDVARGGVLMGIVNVTPDSFSDGGRFYATERAVSHAKELVRQGALILDIGGESTRPGAAEVSAEEELDRVLPVVRELRSCTDAVISVDTRHAAVAAAVLEAGADVINDISGLREAGSERSLGGMGFCLAGHEPLYLMYHVFHKKERDASQVCAVKSKEKESKGCIVSAKWIYKWNKAAGRRK